MTQPFDGDATEYVMSRRVATKKLWCIYVCDVCGLKVYVSDHNVTLPGKNVLAVVQ